MKNTAFFGNHDAVSEVIGAMLLVVIAVAAFAIIYTQVFPIKLPGPEPHVQIAGYVASNGTVTLEHIGGEELVKYRIIVTQSGGSQNNSSPPHPWKIGEPIYLDTSLVDYVQFNASKQVRVAVVDIMNDGSTYIIFEGIITPNDYPPGTTVPPPANPMLLSTLRRNTSDEDLICYNYTIHSIIKPKTFIYNWSVNGNSLAKLLLPFDTKDSGQTKDYSGSHKNGNITGAIWTKGILGGAYSFSGNSYIDIPYCFTTNKIDTVTIEAWINTGQSSGTILSYNRNNYLELSISNGHVKWSTNSSDGIADVNGTTFVSDNLWHLIAVTYNSASGVSRIYVDGKLDSSRQAHKQTNKLLGSGLKSPGEIGKTIGVSGRKTIFLTGFETRDETNNWNEDNGSAQGIMDPVDNNASNVDGSVDKGAETNFANAQASAPDGSSMTIQEADTAGQDHKNAIQGNTCNVDSSPDLGTETNFANAQGTSRDSNNMTIREVDVAGNYKTAVQGDTTNRDGSPDLGTETNFAGARGTSPDVNNMSIQEIANYDNVNHSVDWAGTNKDALADIGTETTFSNCQATTRDGNVMTVTEADNDSGTSSFGKTAGNGNSYVTQSANTMYGGIFTTSATQAGEIYQLQFYGRADSGSVNVKGVICDSTGVILTNGISSALSVSSSVGTKILLWSAGSRPIVQKSTTYWLMIIPDGTLRFMYDSTSGGTSKYDSSNSYASPSNPTDATADTHTWRLLLAGINNIQYVLNTEYQFNSTHFSSENEKLCMYLTTSPTETLIVKYWTGSAWSSLGNIVSSGWNNFTVIGLTSATYNIQLRDQNDTWETTQHSWGVDCMYLHTWNTTANYRLDFEYNWSSAHFAEATKQLCFYLPAHTGGSEYLMVKYWTGSAWGWVGNITATGWTNLTARGLTSASYTIRLNGSKGTGDTVQDAWFIDCMFFHCYNASNYLLDFEYNWSSAHFAEATKQLCFYLPAHTGGSEYLMVKYWTGSAWGWVGNITATGWTNLTARGLTSASYTIRLNGSKGTGDTVQDAWFIDCIFLHTYNATNYQIDLEYQWTAAVYNMVNEQVCFYIASHTGFENLLLNYWTGSAWSSLGTITGTGWVNFTATGLTSSTYTIQLKGSSEASDSSQDTWKIDVLFLHTWTTQRTFDMLPSTALTPHIGSFSLGGSGDFYPVYTLFNRTDIDLVGYQNVQLSVWYSYKDTNSNDFFGLYYKNNSQWDPIFEITNPTQSGQKSWTQVIVTLPKTLDKLRLQFKWRTTGSNEYMAIDDLEITGVPSIVSNNFTGIIDEVKIYQRELSTEQLYQDYLCTKDGNSSRSVLVAEEIHNWEQWICYVTPNDSTQDDSTITSNPLTITGGG